MRDGFADTPPADTVLAAAMARRDGSPSALRAAREACELLYHRHAPALAAYLCSRIPRHEIDDTLQEVWARAWRQPPDRCEGNSLRPWLLEIARNLVRDRYRRPPSLPLDDEPMDSTISHDSRLMADEQTVVFRRCLERLTPAAAEVVRLRLQGNDYPTIAKQTGTSPERLHKLFHKAKQALRQCVERALK